MPLAYARDTAVETLGLSCPGVPFEVWIEVDGKRTPYYSREHDEIKKEVTCWIESQAGKPFSIHYRSMAEEYGVQVDLHLDGTKAGNYCLLPNHANKVYATKSIQVSNNEVCSLVFGTLELTDDDSYLKQSSLAEKFGEIRVVIKRCASFTETDPSAKPVYNTYAMPDTIKIHERAKKGLSHMIKQGQKEQKAAACGRYKIEPGPLLTTFLFRYRPRAMLQANGVVPPDPTPSSSHEPEAEIGQSSSEDEDAAAAEERALVARLEEIRKKRQLEKESRSSGNPRKKVKLEREPPKLQFVPGETIGDDIRCVLPTSKSSKPKVVVDLTA